MTKYIPQSWVGEYTTELDEKGVTDIPLSLGKANETGVNSGRKSRDSRLQVQLDQHTDTQAIQLNCSGTGVFPLA